jgi:hypothetical protein
MRGLLASVGAAGLLVLAAAGGASASTVIHVRISSPPEQIANSNPFCLFGQFAGPATAADGALAGRVERCWAQEIPQDDGSLLVLGNWTFALPDGLIFVTNAVYIISGPDPTFVVLGGGQITGGTGIYADVQGSADVRGGFSSFGSATGYRVVWSLHLA